MQGEMVAWQSVRLHVRRAKPTGPAQQTLSICAKATLMYMTAVLPSHRLTLNSAPIGRIAFTYTCGQGAAPLGSLQQPEPYITSANAELLAFESLRRAPSAVRQVLLLTLSATPLG